MKERVLCVDDEERILSAIKRTLRNRFAIDTATGPADALRRLEEDGPYAVVVSDMTMPGEDGVGFLEQVRERWPDTVRLMLTGNADQATAVEAVNRGRVFRFLNKPCQPVALAGALESALEHHRLLCSERELLEGTVRGCVEVLTTMLSLSDPQGFGRAERMGRAAGRLATALGLERPWEVEVAAQLSQAARAALPPGLTERELNGEPLDEEERAMLARIPEASCELLEPIPRFERVVELIRSLTETTGRTSPPPGGLESQVLFAVSEWTRLLEQGFAPTQAIDELTRSALWLDASVRRELQRLLFTAPQARGATRYVEARVADLEIGDVLAGPIETADGRRLINEGSTITPVLLQRIENYSRTSTLREPIRLLPTAAERRAS